MPDHVINEVLLHNVNSSQCRQFVLDDKDRLSFEVLLPLPLHLWRGDFDAEVRNAFAGSSMDAAFQFWGTMRDAYGDVKVDDTAEGTLLRFQTAWDHPRGWLCALFNKLNCDITASWLCEGTRVCHVETYKVEGPYDSATWEAAEFAEDSDEYGRLYELLYGEPVRNGEQEED